MEVEEAKSEEIQQSCSTCLKLAGSGFVVITFVIPPGLRPCYVTEVLDVNMQELGRIRDI